MGVDYHRCDGCEFGYRDDSEYVVYCDCGGRFCSKECGQLDNYDGSSADGQAIDDSKPITCVVCRKEKSTDYVLLQALLRHFDLSLEDAEKIWREEKERC